MIAAAATLNDRADALAGEARGLYDQAWELRQAGGGANRKAAERLVSLAEDREAARSGVLDMISRAAPASA